MYCIVNQPCESFSLFQCIVNKKQVKMHSDLFVSWAATPRVGGGGRRGDTPPIFFGERTAMAVSHPIISPCHIHFMGHWLLHAPVLHTLWSIVECRGRAV